MYQRYVHFAMMMLINSACVTTPSTTPSSTVIPDRITTSTSGSVFIQRNRNVSEMAREGAIERECINGNIPSFLRQLVKITYSGKTSSGKMVTVTLQVMPDYLAIGDDRDYVRIPMSPITAQRIADRFRMSLPTTKIVDTIYSQAKVKLVPKPMTPGPQMVSFDRYLQHHRIIQTQLGASNKAMLVAGHKKDIVLTNRLQQKPRQVAIYGWHRSHGKPIQPLSTVHGNRYADYSHGVRLISNEVIIDNKTYSLVKVLADPELAILLSYEGQLKIVRYNTDGQKRSS